MRGLFMNVALGWYTGIGNRIATIKTQFQGLEYDNATIKIVSQAVQKVSRAAFRISESHAYVRYLETKYDPLMSLKSICRTDWCGDLKLGTNPDKANAEEV